MYGCVAGHRVDFVRRGDRHWYQCPFCFVQTMTPEVMKDHYERKHEAAVDRSHRWHPRYHNEDYNNIPIGRVLVTRRATSDNPPIYYCPTCACGGWPLTYSELQSHYNKYHAHAYPDIEELKKTQRKEKRQNSPVCFTCKIIFKTPQALDNHLQSPGHERKCSYQLGSGCDTCRVVLDPVTITPQHVESHTHLSEELPIEPELIENSEERQAFLAELEAAEVCAQPGECIPCHRKKIILHYTSAAHHRCVRTSKEPIFQRQNRAKSARAIVEQDV